MFGVIVIYMATPHLATYMSLSSTSPGFPGEPATESHTSVSATMSYNECYNVCSGNGTIYCALQGDHCICFDTYVRSSVDQRESAVLRPCDLVSIACQGCLLTILHPTKDVCQIPGAPCSGSAIRSPSLETGPTLLPNLDGLIPGWGPSRSRRGWRPVSKT